MSWANEGDTGFRSASYAFAGGALAGALSCQHQKIVDDEALKSGNANTPNARPVDLLDAREVTRVHDLAAIKAESASPGNMVSTFDAADGGAGSVTVGPVVPRGVEIVEGRNQNGFFMEQEYRMLGSSLTFAVVI